MILTGDLKLSWRMARELGLSTDSLIGLPASWNAGLWHTTTM